MKYLSLLLVCALAIVAVGCESTESLRSRVRERFSAPPFQTKVVAVDTRAAYEAAKAAAAQMSFRYERGGPAQGKLEAVGPLGSADGRGTARQVTLEVKISNNIEGGSKIEALFSEVVEEDFNKRRGEGTIRPLRDSSLYGVFFAHIDQVLAKR